MVILNALLGLILKLTSVYASIYDLVDFIIGLYDTYKYNGLLLDPTYNYIIICSTNNTCFLVEKFGSLFYLISLSIYLFFFYHFDKNFRTSFLRLFFNDEKKNTKKDVVKTS